MQEVCKGACRRPEHRSRRGTLKTPACISEKGDVDGTRPNDGSRIIPSAPGVFTPVKRSLPARECPRMVRAEQTCGARVGFDRRIGGKRTVVHRHLRFKTPPVGIRQGVFFFGGGGNTPQQATGHWNSGFRSQKNNPKELKNISRPLLAVAGVRGGRRGNFPAMFLSFSVNSSCSSEQSERARGRFFYFPSYRVRCRYLIRCGRSASAPRRFLRSSSYSLQLPSKNRT